MSFGTTSNVLANEKSDISILSSCSLSDFPVSWTMVVTQSYYIHFIPMKVELPMCFCQGWRCTCNFNRRQTWVFWVIA